jgi:hypothetical protein
MSERGEVWPPDPIRVPAPLRERKICAFCGCPIETGEDFMWALEEAKRRGRAVLFEEDMCTERAVFPSNKHAAMLQTQTKTS